MIALASDLLAAAALLCAAGYLVARRWFVLLPLLALVAVVLAGRS